MVKFIPPMKDSPPITGWTVNVSFGILETKTYFHECKVGLVNSEAIILLLTLGESHANEVANRIKKSLANLDEHLKILVYEQIS